MKIDLFDAIKAGIWAFTKVFVIGGAILTIYLGLISSDNANATDIRVLQSQYVSIIDMLTEIKTDIRDIRNNQ